MSAQTPRVSVVVPARNASATLARCLGAVAAQANSEIELIVVDDYSTDDTRSIASRYPAQLISLPQHLGVAAARNRGAEEARAEILFFLDADVILAPGGMQRVMATMADPEIGAVIGSYDSAPDDQSIVSRFKNLAHHHFHQRSSREATTFWGACGAIRRHLFVAAGGFDEKRYKLPSIEDIELGFRLSARGVRIVLDPELQVKHLKKWTLGSLVETDVVRRAIPWTLLWMEHGRAQNDLNFSWDQRIAALISVAMVLAIIGAMPMPLLWLVVIALAACAVLINRDLFRLLLARGGVPLALAGFFLQQLYYLYSLFGLAAGLTLYAFGFRARDASPLKQA